MKSPFKFLDSYQEEDKDIFFGREEEIRELYERLFETNILILYGGSGTGKSSLIQCGLANQFQPQDWLPIFIRREKQLLPDLQQALFRKLPEDKQHGDFLQQPLPDQLWQLYLSHFKPIYLIFDQFEELFIQGDADGAEARTFFDAIEEVLEREVQCKILISLREEYFAQLSDFELIVPDLLLNKMRLEKMRPANLIEVIECTCASFNIFIDEREQSITAIINNLKDNRGEVELANLQIYLDKLYRNRVAAYPDEPVVFDGALVRKTKSIEDVLTDFLEEQISSLERELREKGIQESGIPLSVLLALITDDGTKKISTVNDIRNELFKRRSIPAEIVNYCVDRFVDLRLIKILGTVQS